MEPHSPVRRKPSQARRARAASHLPQPQTPETHAAALLAVRKFMKSYTPYDVFPVSFKQIVIDTQLEVKKALQALLQNGNVSAPLWNSEKNQFAGLFTVLDIIHLIQYYYATATSMDSAVSDVEHFRLEAIRDIERAINVPPPPLISVHPLESLYEACRMMLQTHAHRLPLIDKDSQTSDPLVLSVLTQYRVLKFIAANCRDTSHLHMSLRTLGIGAYVQPGVKLDDPHWPLATATMDTTVFDVVHMFSARGISAVPIVDSNGKVINLYETVDVITLVRNGAYQHLDLTISEALSHRSADFPGVITCTGRDSLGALMFLLRQRRVHRLVVVEGEEVEESRRGRLVGIISLSDVLKYLVGPIEGGALQEK
ncbi:CBS-domain-containing protein [Dacryopinax primogenitus]|uniref:CBS-domain-containing protein n=1 Tax=Dacryopinax primogenitus (strain DJM 731) TaxID=1858805 RepID=M5FSI6_DACPD|nr:CBS-domain-containing protein [Dacryopinax primogenitus]EJT98853.1 CBS-domain-containing protein [Dacryopinax primogenitus]